MSRILISTMCCAVMTFLMREPLQAGPHVGIADGGRALAVIVLPDESGDTEEFAAGELQSYLEKISGAELPVVAESKLGNRPFISVGRTRLSESTRERLADDPIDAFIIEAVNGGILLAGGGDSGRSPGTLFAVYDFLERDLGCRWLGPGELWEHVPRRNTLNVSPENRHESPAFLYRFSSTFGRQHHWGIKNKANMGRQSWPFEWFTATRGRGVELPLFDIPGWSGFHSAPTQLLPISGRGVDINTRERVMSDHPEWTALQGNGRRATHVLCHANPEVNDLIADRLSQMFRERPHMGFVQLGEGDGYSRGRCLCEACLDADIVDEHAYETRRGTDSYRMRMWENRIAGMLAETDPGKKLLGVAYASFQEPLDPAIVRPAENVMIDYFTWSDSRTHGYEHDSAGRARSRAWIEAWCSVTPAGMIMAEYLSRNSMDGISGSQPRRYVRDMRYLRRHGFVGYRPFINANSWGLYSMNRYAVKKAMWNPDIDEDELVRDYCDHAFHEASEPMQRFINTIEAGMKAGASGVGDAWGWTVVPGVLEEARQHLDAALAAAENNEIVRQRLVTWEIHFQYCAMAGPAWVKIYRAAYSRRHGIERDAGLLREAKEEGQAAVDYLSEMRRKYRDHPDAAYIRGGHRMRRNWRDDGRLRAILRQLERD